MKLKKGWEFAAASVFVVVVSVFVKCCFCCMVLVRMYNVVLDTHVKLRFVYNNSFCKYLKCFSFYPFTENIRTHTQTKNESVPGK